MSLFCAFLWSATLIAFVSTGTAPAAHQDGRASRVLIVDETTSGGNVSTKADIIPSQSAREEGHDSSSESADNRDGFAEGDLTDGSSAGELSPKGVTEACTKDHHDPEYHPLESNDIPNKLSRKKLRYASLQAPVPRGAPYPAYRTYLQGREETPELRKCFGSTGAGRSNYFRSGANEALAQRGRTFWPFTLMYDNYYDYPPYPPPPPPPYPLYPPPPPPYGGYGPW